MKDVRDGGNVDESRFPRYTQRRRLGRWLRALAAACLVLTMAGGFMMVLGGIASGASAHVLAPNQPCSVLPAAAAWPKKFCLKADGGVRQVQLTWNPPAPVTNVTVSQPARSVTVSQPVRSVTIYQGQALDNGQPPKVSDGQPANVSETTDKSAVVIGLTTGIQYYFWLVRGQAVVSDQVPATPVKQATTPGAPIGLAATPSDGQVSLKWDPPVPNGGPDVTGYNVYYATSADFKAATKVPRGADTTFVVDRLVNGTTYHFWVTAVSGRYEGQASCEATATPVGKLAAPTRLSATPGDGQVTLSWAAPESDGGSPVTGYNLYYATSADFAGAAEVHWGTGTGLVLRGLVNGTTYYFRVTAVNRLGEGGPSDPVNAVPVGAPAAPTRLSATPGDGQVTLSWAAPGSDGGSPVTGYNLYYATSADFAGAAEVHWGTGTGLVLRGLVNGTTYYFQVTAANQIGESQRSNAVKAVPVGLPGAPTRLSATPADGHVTLSWAAPGSDGGSRVTGYNVYYAMSADFAGAVVVHGGTGTGLVVDRLVNGTTYYFRVTAVNRVGEGPASGEAKAVPVGLPGAPTKLTAAADDGKVTLSWAAPASGGAPITGYDVYYATSADFAGAAVVHGGTGTGLVVDRLVNGTTYFFRVTAVNRVGEGPASGEAKAVPVGVPGAPAGLTATRGDAKAALAWTAPRSNGGSPVTGYNVYVATSADFKGATKVTSGTGTAVTVTGLVNGTKYYFRVTAVNRVGEGPASAAAKAVPATVPGTPAGLTATPGKSKVTLRWAAPPSGGSPITGYIIYKGTSPGGESGPAVNASLVTATSYTVTSLVNGTPYYFEVFAVNTVGQGSSSNEASATLPLIVPPTSPTSPTAPAFPGPTGLTATAGDTKVRLSWTAPASDGGSPVTGYKIYVATTPDAQQSARIVTAKSADATVTHLVNGTTYYFMVTAVNTAGHESPSSTEVSAEPAKLGTQVKVSADSPTVPPQLIALITAAAAMVTAAGFTLIMRGRSRVGSRKRTHSEHSHEPEVGSDVRAVADPVRLDAVSVRDIGQEPTHSVRFEPHPGVSTTTIKEGRP